MSKETTNELRVLMMGSLEDDTHLRVGGMSEEETTNELKYGIECSFKYGTRHYCENLGKNNIPLAYVDSCWVFGLEYEEYIVCFCPMCGIKLPRLVVLEGDDLKDEKQTVWRQ